MSAPLTPHRSPAEVAKILGVTKQSVYNYLKENKLGHVKLGDTGTIRISDEHIRKFLKK